MNCLTKTSNHRSFLKATKTQILILSNIVLHVIESEHYILIIHYISYIWIRSIFIFDLSFTYGEACMKPWNDFEYISRNLLLWLLMNVNIHKHPEKSYRSYFNFRKYAWRLFLFKLFSWTCLRFYVSKYPRNKIWIMILTKSQWC